MGDALAELFSSPDFKHRVARLTIPQLKEVLKLTGGRLSGKKEDLVERVVTAYKQYAQKYNDDLMSAATLQEKNEWLTRAQVPAAAPRKPKRQHENTEDVPPKRARTEPVPPEVLALIKEWTVPNTDLRLDLSDDPFVLPIKTQKAITQFYFSHSPSHAPSDFYFDIPEAIYKQCKLSGQKIQFRCFLPVHASTSNVLQTKASPVMYPTEFSLKVNDFWVVSRTVQQTNSKSKSFSTGHDITVPCRPGRNVMLITGAKSYQSYYIAVQWMEVHSVETLSSRVTEKKTMDFEAAKNRILKKFDAESEVQAVSSKVSILDPLVKSKLKIPARASTCNHIECFDLNNYLMMNERIRTWKCPVCSKQAAYDDLVVDAFFLKLLANLPNDEISEVEITPEGQWKFPLPEDEKPKPKVKRKETKVQMIALDSEDEDGESGEEEEEEEEEPLYYPTTTMPMTTTATTTATSSSYVTNNYIRPSLSQSRSGFATQNDPISLDDSL